MLEDKATKDLTADEKVQLYPKITCSKCGETKDREEFYKRSRSRTGKQGMCKVCNCAYQTVYRSANPYKCLYARLWHKCYNHKHPHYKHYGARGIGMFEPWLNNFERFKADIIDELGPQPPTIQMSIDRIDNDGNYEPGNIRLATRAIQARNKRSSHYYFLTDKGGNVFITHSLNDFCEKHGLHGGNMSDVVNGKLSHYKGWTGFKILKPTIDQVVEAEITDGVDSGEYSDGFIEQ